jgi:hypothetical protein
MARWKSCEVSTLSLLTGTMYLRQYSSGGGWVESLGFLLDLSCFVAAKHVVPYSALASLPHSVKMERLDNRSDLQFKRSVK